MKSTYESFISSLPSAEVSQVKFSLLREQDEADKLNHADPCQGSTNPAWAWPSPSSVPGNLTSFIKDLLFATAVQKTVS